MTSTSESSREDDRLEKAVTLVRQMSNPNLKEQCLRTEWASLQTDLERDLLCQVAAERPFWDDVKEITQEDLQDNVDADDDVDVDQRMLQMFKCFDKDGSGSIDASEFHQMLLYMGNPLSDGDVREMMASVDEDHDGAINEQEFLHVMKVLLPQKTQGVSSSNNNQGNTPLGSSTPVTGAGSPVTSSLNPTTSNNNNNNANVSGNSNDDNTNVIVGSKSATATSAKQNIDAQSSIRAANTERDDLAVRSSEALADSS